MRRSAEGPLGRQCITSSGGLSSNCVLQQRKGTLLLEQPRTLILSIEVSPENEVLHADGPSSAAMQVSSSWEQCCGCWPFRTRASSGR